MRNASGHNYWNSSFIMDVAMGQIPRSTDLAVNLSNVHVCTDARYRKYRKFRKIYGKNMLIFSIFSKISRYFPTVILLHISVAYTRNAHQLNCGDYHQNCSVLCCVAITVLTSELSSVHGYVQVSLCFCMFLN